MTAPEETRRTRLKNDYLGMCNLRSSVITWRALRGTPPYVEAYHLSVNIHSIVGAGPVYRDQHLISLEVPARYPYSAPRAVMLTEPVVFHPNWWPSDHRWCYGRWVFSEGLAQYVVRMLRTLQFDDVITSATSLANKAAGKWYVANRNKGLFPCDRQPLPDPLGSRVAAALAIKKKFEVRR